VLNVLAGKPTEDLEKYAFAALFCSYRRRNLLMLSCRRLQETEPSHALLADIQEKSEFFDTAAAKYSAKVSS
jgi:coatomer protein complex subunit epsilon